MDDQHKILIHLKAHHHPHAYRELELKRLEEEVSSEWKRDIAYELARYKHERHQVITKGMQVPCEHLLRCHVEDAEYRALFGAAQLMLSQAHGLKKLGDRFEEHWREIANVDFSTVSPWLAKLHTYLAGRLHVFRVEEERIDAMQNFGRTNEHASLRAECTNMNIRHFDDVFATSTRVSRWEPRLVELIEALRISEQQLLLIEAQNAIYNGRKDSQIDDQKQQILGFLANQGRYKPLYMLDRTVVQSDLTKDLVLDSDYNSKNLGTLREMITMFEGELAEIRKSKRDTAAEIIEGAIGAAVNDCITSMEWSGELTELDLPTKAGDLTRVAIKQVMNFREIDNALHIDKKIDTKQAGQRVRQSWAITFSHAIMAADLALALRLRSSVTTFQPLREYRPLSELLQG